MNVTVRMLDGALRACEPDEVIALAIPFQDQRDRAAALDHFNDMVEQLRAAGWHLNVTVVRKPDGEAYAIEPTATPTTPDHGHY